MSHIYPDRSRPFLSGFWFCYLETNILRMPIKRTALAMTRRKSPLPSAIPAPSAALYVPQSSRRQLTPTCVQVASMWRMLLA
jgi:hypothetical protein